MVGVCWGRMYRADWAMAPTPRHVPGWSQEVTLGSDWCRNRQGCGITRTARPTVGSGSLTPSPFRQNSFGPVPLQSVESRVCRDTGWCGSVLGRTGWPAGRRTRREFDPVAVAGALVQRADGWDEHMWSHGSGDAYCWGGTIRAVRRRNAYRQQYPAARWRIPVHSRVGRPSHTCGVTTRGVVLLGPG